MPSPANVLMCTMVMVVVTLIDSDISRNQWTVKLRSFTLSGGITFRGRTLENKDVLDSNLLVSYRQRVKEKGRREESIRSRNKVMKKKKKKKKKKEEKKGRKKTNRKPKKNINKRSRKKITRFEKKE